MTRMNFENLGIFKSWLWKKIFQIVELSNFLKFKIIENDDQFALIPWEYYDENAVLSLCVGVYVGRQFNLVFDHLCTLKLKFNISFWFCVNTHFSIYFISSIITTRLVFKSNVVLFPFEPMNQYLHLSSVLSLSVFQHNSPFSPRGEIILLLNSAEKIWDF